MSIVREGRLTVSLFHGTSTLFYDSILSNGLGGRNIVEDMGIRDAARKLLELSAPYREQEEWMLDINGCDNIAADPANDRVSNNKLFNFRYGGTYVSASSETASTYASLYASGGEALTHVLKLYRRLSAIFPGMVDSPQFAALASFASKPARPLLVEAAEVEIDSLRSEHGGEIQEILDGMESALEDPEFYDALVGQHNFELTRPVAASQLRFYEPAKITEFDGEGGSREILKLSPFVA